MRKVGLVFKNRNLIDILKEGNHWIFGNKSVETHEMKNQFTTTEDLNLLLKNTDFKAIAGVNMPMVCHAVLARNSEIGLEELFRQCISAGKEAQTALNEVFDNMHETVENDF